MPRPSVQSALCRCYAAVLNCAARADSGVSSLATHRCRGSGQHSLGPQTSLGLGEPPSAELLAVLQVCSSLHSATSRSSRSAGPAPVAERLQRKLGLTKSGRPHAQPHVRRPGSLKVVAPCELQACNLPTHLRTALAGRQSQNRSSRWWRLPGCGLQRAQWQASVPALWARHLLLLPAGSLRKTWPGVGRQGHKLPLPGVTVKTELPPLRCLRGNRGPVDVPGEAVISAEVAVCTASDAVGPMARSFEDPVHLAC